MWKTSIETIKNKNNEASFQMWIEIQETAKINYLIKKVKKLKAQIPQIHSYLQRMVAPLSYPLGWTEETVVGTRFHEPASLLIADCMD